MTVEELTTLRVGVRVIMLESLVGALFRRLSKEDPEFATWKSRLLKDALQSADHQTMPGLSPEYSDLASAEYRDALQGLVDFMNV